MKQYHNLSQLIEVRKIRDPTNRDKTYSSLINPQRTKKYDQYYEQRVQNLSKKQTFTSEDKLLAFKIMQKRYHLCFDYGFSLSLINFRFIKKKCLLEVNYDGKINSYFVLKGEIAVFEKKQDMECLDEKNLKRQLLSQRILKRTKTVNAECGVGKVFNQSEIQSCYLVCENSILIELSHQSNQQKSIIHNCSITNEQKQDIIKKQFQLFKNYEEINKHVPNFHEKVYKRGQYIYKIGDRSENTYFIVDGEVQIQSKITVNYEEKDIQVNPLSSYLRSAKKNQNLKTTEILGSYQFFGQSQILASKIRQNSVKCISITCVILQLSKQKFVKLLNNNKFKENILKLSNQRKLKRKQKIQNIQKVGAQNHLKRIEEKRASSRIINFNDFNERLAKKNNKQKQDKNAFSFKLNRRKILHGNFIKNNNQFVKVQKAQNFSMLEVNQQHFQKSKKRYRKYTQQSQSSFLQESRKDNFSLKRMWNILKLESVLGNNEEKIASSGYSTALKFYDASLRKKSLISRSKSYRPKTISSHPKTKTQYVQFLTVISQN